MANNTIDQSNKTVLDEAKIETMINTRMHTGLSVLENGVMRKRELNNEISYCEDQSLKLYKKVKEISTILLHIKSDSKFMAHQTCRLTTNGIIPFDDYSIRVACQYLVSSSPEYEKSLKPDLPVTASTCSKSLIAFHEQLKTCIEEVNKLSQLIDPIQEQIKTAVTRATV